VPDLIFDYGLYYANSIEYLASSLELQAISSKNIVNII